MAFRRNTKTKYFNQYATHMTEVMKETLIKLICQHFEFLSL